MRKLASMLAKHRREKIALLCFTGLTIGCSSPSVKQSALAAPPVGSAASWMDTVRFNSKLSDEQWQQIYFARNNEEDYKRLKDTARIMLRFFWYRSFHPYTVVRLENRPEIYDSSGVRRVYTEWFALYKKDITRLNHDCPVRVNDKCSGKPYPYVHQEHVELLEANKTPIVINALDSIGFWKMKSVYEDAEPHADGSSWTLEVYYKGKHKQVSTSQQSNPIKGICLKMLKLSGYKIKANELY